VSARLTALGPFFAAGAHDPSVAAAAPWRELGELRDDPAVLAARVEASRGYLAAAGGLRPAAVELRVAASVTHLGLAARTLSPLLALAALYGRARPAVLRDLRWQPAPGGAFPLSIAALDEAPGAQEADADPDVLARGLAKGAIGTVAAELCALTRRFGVSERILWGNVASALNGAGTALSAAVPATAPRVRALVARLLRAPELDGTSQTSLDGRFQRRSCCLIYRAAPDRAGMVCGDCVLLGHSSPEKRSHAD
jgi:hypothetical protein